MKSKSFLILHRARCNWNDANACCCSCRTCISCALFTSKGGRQSLGGEELLNKVIFFIFFAHKKYSRSFVKMRLNHWWQMDYFKDVLTVFLGLGTFQLHCSHRRVRKLCLWFKVMKVNAAIIIIQIIYLLKQINQFAFHPTTQKKNKWIFMFSFLFITYLVKLSS